MVENFELGYTEVSNRPTPIAPSTLTSNDNSLKQNGTWLKENCMWEVNYMYQCVCMYVCMYVYVCMHVDVPSLI